MLLNGLAIENALKALRIEQLLHAGRSPYQQTRRGRALLPELLTHNFPRLAGACGLTLNSGEQWLLRQLQEAVQWAGRYPVPATAPTQASNSGSSMKLIVDGQHEDCRQFYKRLENEFVCLRANRPVR
jgi:hypothetical protein